MMKSNRISSAQATTVAGAYSAGFQVGAVLELAHAVEAKGLATLLKSLTLIDAAKQKIGATIYFFSKRPTLTNAGDKTALDISAAELAAKCLGKVSIVAGDYTDLANASVASVGKVDLMLRPQDAKSGQYEGDSLYAVIQTQGTPTYGAGTFLTLKVGTES